MARRTKRKSRSRRRKRGGVQALSEDDKKHIGEKVNHELPRADDAAGMMEAFKGKVHGLKRMAQNKVKEQDLLANTGGAKRKKGRKGTRKRSKGKSNKKKSRKKRKLNKFFALMLDAKKKGLKSFKYNGKTYKGKKHHRLGLVYKKA